MGADREGRSSAPPIDDSSLRCSARGN